PDAFTMNSEVDSLSAARVPAEIASACLALSRRTNSLKASTSSSFVSVVSGCQTPWPVMAMPVDVRDTAALYEVTGVLSTRRKSRIFTYFGVHFGQSSA